MNNAIARIRRNSILIAMGTIFAGIILLNHSYFSQRIFSAGKTVTCPADGKFHIVEAVICDPDGQPFLPRGIDEFAGPTFGGFEAPDLTAPNVVSNYVDGWKFNMFRIVMCPTGACQSHPVTVQGTDIDKVIQTYTAKKVVVMLDYHQNPLAGPVTQADVNQAIPWFKDMATKYKDNPYVWLETFNEPIDGNDGIQTWLGFTGPIVDAVRSVNLDKIVVVCSGNYGQDSTGNGDSFDQAGSHILNGGATLAAKGNVLFDVHFYSRWANVSTQGAKNYFQALHDAGFAFVIGETWGNPNGQQFMIWDQMATDTLYAAKANGVGILPWSAAGNYPGVNGGRASDINSQTNPTNLTHNGQLHWDWTHNPPSAVPDGYTVSTGGGGGPSATLAPQASSTPGASCPTKSIGDANCDGVPDVLDYAIWRAEYLKQVTTTTADFDGDGSVDLKDFQIWKNNFK